MAEPTVEQAGEAATQHPVAAALSHWLASPDVLADPYQVDGDRVWTRAEEVLPGVSLMPGHPVTACWGDAVWTGLPEWDPEDPTVLWLRPVTGPAAAPAPAVEYDPARLVERVMARTRAEPAPTPEGLRLALTAVLADLVADFTETVSIALHTKEEDRRTARDLLVHLAQRRGPRGPRLSLTSPLGLRLLRLARRARVPPAIGARDDRAH